MFRKTEDTFEVFFFSYFHVTETVPINSLFRFSLTLKGWMLVKTGLLSFTSVMTMDRVVVALCKKKGNKTWLATLQLCNPKWWFQWQNSVFKRVATLGTDLMWKWYTTVCTCLPFWTAPKCWYENYCKIHELKTRAFSLLVFGCFLCAGGPRTKIG